MDSITVTNNDGDPNTAVTVTIVVSASDADGGLEKAFGYIEGPVISLETGARSIVINQNHFHIRIGRKDGLRCLQDLRYPLYDPGNQNFVSNADLIAGEYTNNWTITNVIGDNDTPQILE